MVRKLVVSSLGALVLAAGSAWALLPLLPVAIREGVSDRAGEARPPSFVLHASEDLGDGTACVVGADEVPGRAQKLATVMRLDGTGKIIWNRSLLVPGEQNGSRATHCAAAGDTMYVLVQRDWTSAHLPRQTAVSVAKLDVATGSRLIGGYAALPKGHPIQDFRDRESHISVWVEPGRANLELADHTLRVKARYFVAALGEGTSPARRTSTRDAEIVLDREYLMPSD